MAGYWSERIDEAAADVLGVLNMGPAAAVGLVGYFRALNGVWRGDAELRSVGREEDPHPADIARAYLAAETVRLLSFDGAERWADRLVAEADRDLGQIRLGDVAVSAGVARASAAAVARAIVRTRMPAAGGEVARGDPGLARPGRGHRRDPPPGDEGRAVSRPAAPGTYVTGAYAAHAVAAAVYEAVAGGSTPARVMERMVGVLAAMHDRNPDWSREV